MDRIYSLHLLEEVAQLEEEGGQETRLEVVERCQDHMGPSRHSKYQVEPGLLFSLPKPTLSIDPVYFSVEQPSKDVDEKANAFFQAIYNSRMSVNQLLEILKKFKDSSNKKEKVHIKKAISLIILFL